LLTKNGGEKRKVTGIKNNNVKEGWGGRTPEKGQQPYRHQEI